MAAIKNIIFDLGGVLLNIDFGRLKKAFEDLGVTNFDDFYTKDTADPIFEALETGSITNETFYAELQKHCAEGTTFLQIQNAWNKILVGFRKESVASLLSLKKKYNIYLLSNTNSIHYKEFTSMFHNEIGTKPFDEYFTAAWYSHLIQKRKPYLETYLYVIQKAGLQAEECLFIDDSKANIEGAIKAGLQTKLLLAEERIENLGL